MSTHPIYTQVGGWWLQPMVVLGVGIPFCCCCHCCMSVFLLWVVMLLHVCVFWCVVVVVCVFFWVFECVWFEFFIS